MIVLHRGEFLGVNRLSYSAGGVVVTKTEYERSVCEDWHVHDNPHITYIVQGRMREKRQRTTYDSGPGELIFYHGNEPHRNQAPETGAANINLELDRSYLRQCDLNETDIGTSMRLNPKARCLILRIFREALRGDGFSEGSILMLVHHLLDGELLKQLSQTRPPWIRTVESFLQDNWDSWSTLADLASAAGVHPFTISKHFPRYFGCTLGDYARRLKIERSLALMKSSPIRSLTEIALACGFADQSHFTRVFKQETGLLPKQYRQL